MQVLNLAYKKEKLFFPREWSEPIYRPELAFLAAPGERKQKRDEEEQPLTTWAIQPPATFN